MKTLKSWRFPLVAAVLISIHAITQPAFAAKKLKLTTLPDPTLTYPITHSWASGKGFFTSYTQLVQTNRVFHLDAADLSVSNKRHSLTYCDELNNCEKFSARVRNTYFLESACEDSNSDCYQAGAPVLFVHGYHKYTSEIGGGGLIHGRIFRR